MSKKSFSKILDSRVFGRSSIGQRSSRGRHVSYRKRIGFEQLEDRMMFAVGIFERIDGGVDTGVSVSAAVPTHGDSDGESDSQASLSQSEADVLATDSNALAQIFVDGIAFVPGINGSFINAPFVNAKSGILFNTNGNWGWVFGDVFANALGEWTFNEDPANTEDLELHVHFFIAATGGPVVTGTGSDGTRLEVHVEGGDGSLTATYSNGSWDVSGTIPGDDPISYDNVSSVNEHKHFSVPLPGYVNLESYISHPQDSEMSYCQLLWMKEFPRRRLLGI